MSTRALSSNVPSLVSLLLYLCKVKFPTSAPVFISRIDHLHRTKGLNAPRNNKIVLVDKQTKYIESDVNKEKIASLASPLAGSSICMAALELGNSVQFAPWCHLEMTRWV